MLSTEVYLLQKIEFIQAGNLDLNLFKKIANHIPLNHRSSYSTHTVQDAACKEQWTGDVSSLTLIGKQKVT